MKHKLHEIAQLTSIIIFILGIIALIVLVVAMSNKSIKPGAFLSGVGFLTIVMLIDIRWLDRNFVNGQWIQKGGERTEP